MRFSLLSLFSGHLQAQTLPPPAAPPLQHKPYVETPQQMLTAYNSLKVSRLAVERWLNFMDEGRYGPSWDEASSDFQASVSRREWVSIAQFSRQPFGQLVSRRLIEQRPFINPEGLPEGKYMVFSYKTDFLNQKGVSEQVTLVLNSIGQWKVFTYNFF